MVKGNSKDDDDWSCTRRAFAMRRDNALPLARSCKHVEAVRLHCQLTSSKELVAAAPVQQSAPSDAPAVPQPQRSNQSPTAIRRMRWQRLKNQLKADLDS
eukprot:TRINITY_DN11357_c0_g1_i1.p2 TRINITY_DN11357_c0_g1~~TRINITY_DN11357_c0_g1_i1.p2  ORF type:complete len:100 (-),score=14.50 TRINITY_DN11357_c0_g1_i1:281-580(-)